MKTMPVLLVIALFGLAPLHATASPRERNSLYDLPPMNSARAAHTLTTLRDGTALVVGGFMGDEHQIAGVELFDPEQRQFHVIENAITPRQSHTATLLPDGRVLITGGYDAQGHVLDTAETFDPRTRKFSAAGRMNTPRANHMAITLRDGRVALLGGGKIDVFDPVSGAFTELSGLTIPRATLQAAVFLKDGRIFIAMTDKSTAILDLQTKSLIPAESMQIARQKFDAVLLADGSVLITGGSSERGAYGKYDSAEIFDPQSNSFVSAAIMSKGRYKHQGSSLFLPSGKVLIAGGAQLAELYDPATDTFTIVKSESPLHGSFSAVTLLDDHRALITGGYFRPTAPSNGAWMYEF